MRETGLHSPAMPAPDPLSRLTSALADQTLLIVLDNCEHVVAQAAALARAVLDGCPGCPSWRPAASRSGSPGDARAAGSAGDAAARISGRRLGALSGHPAVRRAGGSRTAGVRDGAEAAAICAALDGSPLAIELAAARLRTFTVEEVAGRLAEYGPFKLLSRGDRTAAARHRTLHAVVDWSWSLLTPEEQEVARRFSVFSGGATLAAVERVCGDGDILADLVDKSLIDASGGATGCSRRSACSAPNGWRSRVIALMTGISPTSWSWPSGPTLLLRAEQLTWLERLSAEDGNLQAAVRHAVQEDSRAALRLIAALASYRWLAGRRGAAIAASARLLERVGEPPEGLEEEYVLCVLQAAPEATPEQWGRAQQIIEGIDHELRHPFASVMWGMVAGPSDPQSTMRRGRLLGRDAWSRAVAVLGEALVGQFDGRLLESEPGLERALAEFRALGERWGTAQALDALALIASKRGEWARARGLWDEALGLLEELGAADEIMDILCRRAGGLAREGDLVAAGADVRRATDMARTTGWPALVLVARADLARLQGRYGEARTCYQEALEYAKPGLFATEGIRPLVLTGLGRLAEHDGDLAAARDWHGQALATASRDLITELAEVAEGQAGLALLEGDGRRAAYLLGVGVALRGMAVAGDADVARISEGARTLVGAESFAAAFAEGAALTRAAALAALG